MPTSDVEGKDWSKELVLSVRPSIIYDIGPGEGTYSDLLRSELDPSTMWVGVEVWEPYVERYKLREKYHDIIVRDVRDEGFPYTRDGLIIFGDVLEHMDEFDAKMLVRRAKRAFKYILVSLPIVHSPQGEVDGNPYEAHQKDWTYEEMHDFLHPKHAFRGHTLGVFWWERSYSLRDGS